MVMMTNGSKCSSSVEIGVMTKSSDGNARRFIRKETMQKIKSIGGHVSLLIILMLYTAIGGLVFRQIELPAELERLERLRARLRVQRYHFVEAISNNTDVFNLHTLVSMKLRDYEEAVQEAAQVGLLISFVTDVVDQDDCSDSELSPIVTERWSIFQAVFFASTVLTTIGYGNVVPSTNWGRIFCILFAFVGIPLTLIVIADWGKLFANIVMHFVLMIKSNLPFRAKFSCIPMNVTGRRSLGACAAIVLLFLYLAFGAGMFMLWEDDWNFFDGFYFCFVTMTTIGFGDLVPNPMVDTWLLMESPSPVLCIIGVYLIFVLKAGPKMMEKKPAFQLNTVMILYNEFQVLFKYFWLIRLVLQMQVFNE